MSKQTVKTTIYIDQDLFQKAKIEAIKQNKTLKELINDGLQAILLKSKVERKIPKIGGLHLGKMDNNITREDMYEGRI